MESSNNYKSGAIFDDAVLNSPVTIANSEFDDNNLGDHATCSSFCGGLRIQTAGAVTLNGISASDNLGSGLEAYGAAITLKNSVINGNQKSPSAGTVMQIGAMLSNNGNPLHGHFTRHSRKCVGKR